MNKIIKMIEKMKPFFEKIASNPYLTAIRDGFVALMPVVLFSSLFILVAYVPNVWGFHWPKNIEDIIMKVYNFTMGMLAVFMAGTVTKSLTDNRNLKLPKTNQINVISTFVAAEASLLILAVKPIKDGISIELLGTKGLIAAFLVAFIVPNIYKFCIGRNITGAFPPDEQYNTLKCLQAQHNQIAAYKHDIFMNGFMLDGTFLGYYTPAKLTVVREILGEEFEQLDIREEELEEIRKAAPQLDFLGINYYQSNWIKYHNEESYIHHNGTGDKGTSVFRVKGIGEVVKNEAIPTNDWDWYIYPEGLYDMMERIKNDYPNYKKIYVTENGLGYKDVLEDNGEVHDDERIDYVRQHIEAIERAYADGINVKGYFIWSLQDMFSWSNGYNKRYGLFYIDFETQKRYVKDSAKWYKQLSDDIYGK
ncbi:MULTISPECIES: family 1 glycosylhydrolase [Staphylococcus]|uniref:family 1 glycosylhydrolase n=1 Tax=Staphylococcus TaxID=1279 RepID=UPI000798A1EE|nr:MULTISPECIES: family 1 glycosylhydrolase [Staphylococcus]KXA45896.1 phosphotransferase system, EIIC [Staphylococcus simulans]